MVPGHALSGRESQIYGWANLVSVLKQNPDSHLG